MSYGLSTAQLDKLHDVIHNITGYPVIFAGQNSARPDGDDGMPAKPYVVIDFPAPVQNETRAPYQDNVDEHERTYVYYKRFLLAVIVVSNRGDSIDVINKVADSFCIKSVYESLKSVGLYYRTTLGSNFEYSSLSDKLEDAANCIFHFGLVSTLEEAREIVVDVEFDFDFDKTED